MSIKNKKLKKVEEQPVVVVEVKKNKVKQYKDFTDENIMKVLDLVDKGCSGTFITRVLNCSQAAVKKVLSENSTLFTKRQIEYLFSVNFDGGVKHA